MELRLFEQLKHARFRAVAPGFAGVTEAVWEMRREQPRSRWKLWKLDGIARAAAPALRKGLHGIKWDLRPDSVDGLPSWEHAVATRGEWSEGSPVRDVAAPVVSKLVEFARERLDLPSATMDAVICRRYAPGERRSHPPHTDSHAAGTVVVDLSPDGAYTGGLFVQTGPRSDSRVFVPLGEGDAVLHSCAVEHGVAVSGGYRQSMIVWVRDSEGSVRSQCSPWWRERAARGDPDAELLLGLLALEGGNDEEAEGWFRKAAAAGNHAAQLQLGSLLMKGGATYEGMSALRDSVNQGYAPAMRVLACELGTKTEAGRSLLEQAADQGCAKSLLSLVKDHPSAEAALEGLRRCADAGIPEAQYTLGCVHLQEEEHKLAVRWFMRAARQGHEETLRRFPRLSTVVGIGG
eukprot:TRINITY_DN22927_c0_g1_i2.p1 TRINITY_DN22927_c0_g1~~TRINITY_DN22927_c0_g1_i2.p1  ORF type:complete len:429 (+),score=113.99 TRINITY_DN22927_c0_g1_i2:75-1289(+)